MKDLFLFPDKLKSKQFEWAIDHIYHRIESSPIAVMNSNNIPGTIQEWLDIRSFLICDCCKSELLLNDGMGCQNIVKFIIEHKNCDAIMSFQ